MSSFGALPSIADLSKFKPFVGDLSVSRFNHANTQDITITGSYFDPAMTVDFVGQTVNSVTFVSPTEIVVNVTSNSTDGLYDVSLTTTCGTTLLEDAFEVKLSTWLDMRLAADVTAAGVNATAGVTVTSTANGLQLTPTNSAWNKIVRFDGTAGAVNDTYSMVFYRTGTARRWMPGLANMAMTVEPWAGGNSYQAQHIGMWNSGAGFTTAYGTDSNSGGTTWSQNIGVNINTPSGSYTMLKFINGGQNGTTVEIWSSDASFNELTLLHSYTSTKPATSATSLALSAVPFDAGASDYFIVGLKVGA